MIFFNGDQVHLSLLCMALKLNVFGKGRWDLELEKLRLDLLKIKMGRMKNKES